MNVLASEGIGTVGFGLAGLAIAAAGVAILLADFFRGETLRRRFGRRDEPAIDDPWLEAQVSLYPRQCPLQLNRGSGPDYPRRLCR